MSRTLFLKVAGALAVSEPKSTAGPAVLPIPVWRQLFPQSLNRLFMYR